MTFAAKKLARYGQCLLIWGFDALLPVCECVCWQKCRARILLRGFSCATSCRLRRGSRVIFWSVHMMGLSMRYLLVVDIRGQETRALWSVLIWGFDALLPVCECVCWQNCRARIFVFSRGFLCATSCRISDTLWAVCITLGRGCSAGDDGLFRRGLEFTCTTHHHHTVSGAEDGVDFQLPL